MLEKEVIIDSTKLRYVEKQGGDVVCVFLHGWGSDHTIFSSLYEVVDAAVAFDFPGCGGSSEPGEVWDLAAYANITKEFVAKKVGGKKIVFFAHSFGGRVLLKMLNQGAMENIQQIVFAGVPFIRRQSMRYDFLRAYSAFVSGSLSYLPGRVGRGIREMWHKIVGADDYGAIESDSMRKTFQNILDEDMVDLFGALKQYKTDFIWGEHDTAAPLSDAASVAGESGAALHVIKDGDHFPFIGNTERAFVETFRQVIRI